MKKRFKLFATIASLCLAVTLMAFGIYAATNVTYTVTNSVKYVVDNSALCTITTNVYKLADPDNAAATGSITTVEGISFAETEAFLTDSITTYKNIGTEQAPKYVEDTAVTEKDGGNSYALELDFATSYAYKIVITVNDVKNTNGITVTFEDTLAVAEGSNCWIVETGAGSAEANGSNTFTYYVGLNDVTVPVTTAVSIGNVVVTATGK